jgi:hypothetical protein
LGLREIVEFHQAVLEVSSPRGILDRKPHLLQSYAPVIVATQYFYAGFLKGAEEASLSRSFVIVAYPVIVPIPHRLVPEKRLGSYQNLQILLSDRLVSSLQLRGRCSELGMLPCGRTSHDGPAADYADYAQITQM